MKRRLLVACGLAAVGLGAAGIFLPLLPTTPFLLLALYCFARSSDRLHAWLLNHRVLGRYLDNYLKHRAVPPAAKIFLLAVLWPTLAVSAFMIGRPWAAILLLAVGIGVTIHLLSLGNLPGGQDGTAAEEADSIP